jgi:hypothetical protein
VRATVAITGTRRRWTFVSDVLGYAGNPVKLISAQPGMKLASKPHRMLTAAAMEGIAAAGFAIALGARRARRESYPS